MTDRRVIDYIEKRLKFCGEHYNSKIVGWCARGSIGIGICRYNSDLDLIFWFIPEDEKVHAIHDIYGYGYDGWGENIKDSLRLVIDNLKEYYKKGPEDYQPIWKSEEHRRGGLDCLNLYSILGKQLSNIYEPYGKVLYDTLENTMEPVIITKFLYIRLKSIIKRVDSAQRIDANEYLYTVWRLLLCEHLLSSGLPGEEKIDFLMDRYTTDQQKKEILILRDKYFHTFSKQSLKLRNCVIDEMIQEKSEYIYNKIRFQHPKHEKNSIEDIMKLIRMMSV